jgi:hypothetical protein
VLQVLRFQSEVEFLGFLIIAGKGVTMAANQFQGIREMQRPQKVKDLRMMLGLFGCNEQFAKHSSDLTACLTDLLKKYALGLDNGKGKGLKLLKEQFSEQLLLSVYHPDYRTWMKTDASEAAHVVWI